MRTKDTSRTLWLVLLPSVLATLPVWVGTLPPMTDVPQFAAQVKLFDDLQAHDFPFRNLFVVDRLKELGLGNECPAESATRG